MTADDRDDKLRAAFEEALRTTPSTTDPGEAERYASRPWHRHGIGHKYNWLCALCQDDFDTLLTALVAAVGRVRDAELEQARDRAEAAEEMYGTWQSRARKARERAEQAEAERDFARQIAVTLEQELADAKERAREAVSAALHLKAQTPTAAQATLDRIRAAQQRVRAAQRRTEQAEQDRDRMNDRVGQAVDETIRKAKELADERERIDRVTAVADALDTRGTRTMDSSMCAAAGLIRRALDAQPAEPAGEVTW